MSERFTKFFFATVFLANAYFTVKIEPNNLTGLTEKALAIFLFQFDYFFLFVYICSKLYRQFNKYILLLLVCYASLFLIGMSSLIILDEKQYDIFYSYVQPCVRTLYLIVFISLGIEKRIFAEKINYLLYTIWLIGGLCFLYLLNLYPRQSMFSFNLYWVVIMSFIWVGIRVKRHKIPNIFLFLIGLFFTGLADLYYILSPEARTFELTFLLIRVINTTGEFLLVNYILRFHYPANFVYSKMFFEKK